MNKCLKVIGGIAAVMTALTTQVSAQQATTQFGYAVLSAGVGAPGGLGRGNGALSAQHLGTGEYQVQMGRNIFGCVVNVSLNNVSSGFATSNLASGNSSILLVHTFDGGRGTKADKPFNAIVVCGP